MIAFCEIGLGFILIVAAFVVRSTNGDKPLPQANVVIALMGAFLIVAGMRGGA